MKTCARSIPADKGTLLRAETFHFFKFMKNFFFLLFSLYLCVCLWLRLRSVSQHAGITIGRNLIGSCVGPAWQEVHTRSHQYILHYIVVFDMFFEH